MREMTLGKKADPVSVCSLPTFREDTHFDNSDVATSRQAALWKWSSFFLRLGFESHKYAHFPVLDPSPKAKNCPIFT